MKRLNKLDDARKISKLTVELNSKAKYLKLFDNDIDRNKERLVETNKTKSDS